MIEQFVSRFEELNKITNEFMENIQIEYIDFFKNRAAIKVEIKKFTGKLTAQVEAL